MNLNTATPLQRADALGALVAVVLGTMSSAAPALTRANRPPARDGLIAFTSGDRRAGRSRIWVMHPNGSDRRALTSARTNDSQPSFSPDGRRIVFTRHLNGRDQIWIMSSDGSHQRALVHDSTGDSHPMFSPDDRAIVFQSEHLTAGCQSACGATHISIIDTDGTHERQLTHGSLHDSEPSFSPDSNTIIFTREENATGRPVLEIWRMGANGSNQHRLFVNTQFREGQARFAPDGRTIAFRSDRSGRFQIWLMHADGSHRIRLTHDGAIDTEPFFSPDGRRIVYDSNRTGPTDFQIWIMNADGSHAERITTGPTVHTEPEWGAN